MSTEKSQTDEGRKGRIGRPVKPAPVLGHTDWLTDAHDAEPGMDVVWYDGTDVHRAEIDFVCPDYDAVVTETGEVFYYGMVNTSWNMVIE